ncbi:hypothetical protein RF11_00609 [Thelohanellus kitauei]|uniref:Uncharacterized protein n=1 Tax=Thelohanellus kitauei TaxID=669202 RepID=A0A0C2MGP0_THEKT|nr:hypothetical protein RF11_00609 [Thelohanellus kitauei]
MWDEFNVFDHRENIKVLRKYIEKAKSTELFTQMKAVGKMIFYFTPQHYPQADYLFMDCFPNQLYEVFISMIELGMSVDGYQQKKLIFMDVFIFIFRNTSLLENHKAKSFVPLFAKFIKMNGPILGVNVYAIMDSIKVCILYEPNRVLFINENVIFNFYYFFRIQKFRLSKQYLKRCQKVYTIDYKKISSLNLIKLTENITQIMKKLFESKEIDCAMLLFTVFRMLHRLRLVDEIEFHATKLFDITFSMFLHNFYRNFDHNFFKNISKIWSNIINGSKNQFHINTIDNLIKLSAIFALDLSSKLREVTRGPSNFELTKNKKQRLYLIYFTLVAFPIVDHDANPWLRAVLTELHSSFKKYFKKYSFALHTIENHFLILQYYIKSHTTLKYPISSRDEYLFSRFFKRLASYPSLKIHLSFLFSHLLLKFLETQKLLESNPGSIYDKIKKFTHDLIMALINRRYIDKLQNEQKLFLFDDVKSDHLSMINDDFIQGVFSACEFHLLDSLQEESSEDDISSEYQMCNQAMSMTVRSFNESNYLDQHTAEYYIRVCESSSNNSSPIPIDDDDDSYNTSDSTSVSDISPHTTMLSDLPIPVLLRWFIMIFEMKFLFGDISSKSTSLNFV